VPYATPYPSCVFCGAKADSKEHAIPKWMSKRLGITGELLAGTGNIKATRDRISFASFRAKIFCKACNAHFKHLEDAAIPLVEPMAKGWDISLGLKSQKTLALWAAKTGIALLAAATPAIAQVIPAHHRRSIRDRGRPPDEMWVGYLPWDSEPHIWLEDGTIDLPKDDKSAPPDVLATYDVLFAFRELAFKVTAFTSPIPPRAVLGGEIPSMRRFWPSRTNIEGWPPEAPERGNREDIPDLVAFNPLRRAD
jgi:hypothetical protein